MTIVCGTDFSVPASGAVRAAAAIAARRGETLRLVHVQGDFAPIEEGVAGTDRPREAVFDLARSLLHDEAARARALGADVTEEMAVGDPAFQILAASARSEASLVVVAWLGRTAPTRWIVGSVAEKIARASTVPVLVVRDPEPLVAWARGERPLPITVADDLGESSLGALRWAAAAKAIGEVEVTTVHVASPSEEHVRRGLHVSSDLERLRPEVDAAIRGDLRSRSEEAGLAGANLMIQQGFGRTEPHVVSLADQAGSELLVVGTHRRAGMGRLWHGSVSRGVLFLTTQNIVCAPTAPPAGLSAIPPIYRSILVAIDLSEVGDAAVPHAFAVAPPGATVHLLHVVPELEARVPMGDRASASGPPGSTESELGTDAAISLALARRVPRDVASRGVEVRCHVVHGGVTAEILAAATRVGADLVCLGSHGRTGITAALLGSVARDVMARSSRPVLVVGAPHTT